MKLADAFPLMKQGQTFKHPMIAGARVGLATADMEGMPAEMVGTYVLLRGGRDWSTYYPTEADHESDGWVA